MALFIFTRAILAGKPIEVYNYGKMQRDFTYIDDIIEGVVRVLDRAPQANPDLDAATDPGVSAAPYKLYNVGNNRPVELLRFIEILEQCLGRTTEKRFLPLQPGDVVATCADIDDLAKDFGFRCKTSIEEGIPRFVAWYQSFYGCEQVH